jgi:hypothetical protein
MRTSSLSITLAFLLTPLATIANAACYDLSKSEPHELTGVLSYVIFAGPPNFEDVQKGDTPEPGYILKLPGPICLTGDDFADPTIQFSEVQLVETDKTAGAMKSLVNSNVDVVLSQPMAAETGHHHRPLVAWVTDIFPINDITTEYGTAATTVRAFYYALAAGNGDDAASFIVPEKRIKGPFSASEITRFYGNLVEPLSLVDLKQSGSNEYLVRYRFRSSTGQCDGRAIVRTVARGGRNFIGSIRALDGC